MTMKVWKQMRLPKKSMQDEEKRKLRAEHGETPMSDRGVGNRKGVVTNSGNNSLY